MFEYLLALAITLLIEVPIVAACFPRGQRWRMAATAAIATVVTHLVMHGVVPHWVSSYDDFILVGELLATFCEAGAYFWFSAPRDAGRACIASALANSASFGAGLALFG